MTGIAFYAVLILASSLAVSEAKDLAISVENYERLIDRISQLEKQSENQERLQEKQTAVESRVKRLEKEVLDQQSLIERQQLTIENLKTTLEVNGIVVEEEKHDPKHVSGVRKGRSVVQRPVAFTAVLDHNIEHSGIDQTIVFNTLLLNDGNAYNKNTGVFTVPRQGMYMFYFVFATGYDPHVVWMHIVVNGQSKAAGVANTLQKAHDAQGSNLVLLHLYPGDSVSVATYQYDDVKVYGWRGFTTFSGVLLFEY